MKAARWQSLCLMGVALTLALSGCVSEPGLADLEKAPSSADELPAAIPRSTQETLNEGSIRFAGAAEGVQVWLAEGRKAPLCLIAYQTETKWMSACGDVGISGEFAGYKIIATLDNKLVEDEGTLIGENVLLQKQ